MTPAEAQLVEDRCRAAGVEVVRGRVSGLPFLVPARTWAQGGFLPAGFRATATGSSGDGWPVVVRDRGR